MADYDYETVICTDTCSAISFEQLSKENKKFVYGAMKKGGRAKEFEVAIQWLIDAGLVYKVNKCSKPELPLKFYKDFSAFKLYLSDCGLMGAMADTDSKNVLLGNKVFTEYKGAFTEQYVLQQMVSAGIHNIYYYSAEDSRMKMDFLIQRQGNLLPIEVKGGTSTKATRHISRSYLTNLTCQVPIECNLSLKDVFFYSQGKYKLWMNNSDDRFGKLVCFSPETFVKIKNGRIYSYPMKGTISADLPHAELALMVDEKEAAEHATIVDLIRNDLSREATDVRVDRYRYIDLLHTNKGDIFQTSSEISGKLPDDYQQHIGDILATQLPAGSITGAPKDKTCAIIREAETYERGFYTGIMGIYENCHKEYEEVLQKVYLPIIEN